MDDQTQEFLTRRTLEIAEDDLRRRVLESSPELRRDTEQIAEALRELVKLEREKAWRDEWVLELYPLDQNKSRKRADPELVGETSYGGRKLSLKGYWSLDSDGVKILKIHIFCPS